MNGNQISFQTMQQQFCDWIRDPDLEIPQELPVERMQIYRDLLFNNVSSFIDLVYPVARAMLPELKWQQLLSEFFQKAECRSPLYNDISLEFREYLTDQRHPILQEYPWLAELLQFEWLELYLDTVEIEDVILHENYNWQLTTKVWVLVYQYPVYLWSTLMTLEQVELMPGAIMVWRDEQDKVCIEQRSPLFAMVIEQLNQGIQLTDEDIHTLIQSALADLSESDIYLQIQELKTLLIRLRLIRIPHDFKEV
ncbi:putative DNA-binding domain-containing protein [Acinetobacter calcoaceticus]|uniref:HvfC family RiPP maturation protein n=1 Tax=Acinetobacter calcoaceticus TaxID=471 RepID=UPI0019006373|nr:putative DNA-binding domain-containing protein [Acinetobacter calcoaceticus]MBJ9721161.1 putative DNA-binding domain-containing protein [Acinetobacter calcoaceticus]